MLLAGRTAVVTGSTRGLGRAYVQALAEAGASVVVNGRKPEQCDALVREIAATGGKAVACSESVASWEGCRRIIDACVQSFGRIDILVNNAAIVRDRMLFNMTEDEWDEVIAINLKGHFACAHFASIRMREQRSGRIINMTADSGLRGYTGNTNYTASKGAIAAITRGWALELAKYDVTVNAIAPTAETEMTHTVPANIDAVKAERGIPMARPGYRTGQPEECAPLVVYLASDEAQGITGQVFGIGADRLALYSHPYPKIRAFHEGGWTLDQIRAQLPVLMGRELESIDLRM